MHNTSNRKHQSQSQSQTTTRTHLFLRRVPVKHSVDHEVPVFSALVPAEPHHLLVHGDHDGLLAALGPDAHVHAHGVHGVLSLSFWRL